MHTYSIQLYYCLVYSMIYWLGDPHQIVKPFNVIHNEIVRLIINSTKYTKLTTLYRANDSLNISQIYQLQTGKFMPNYYTNLTQKV